MALDGMRAGTFSPPFSASIHFCQSFHHDPACCVALLNHSSAVAGFESLVQKWYFFAAGGLTMPAMWPEPPRPAVLLHRRRRDS